MSDDCTAPASGHWRDQSTVSRQYNHHLTDLDADWMLFEEENASPEPHKVSNKARTALRCLLVGAIALAPSSSWLISALRIWDVGHKQRNLVIFSIMIGSNVPPLRPIVKGRVFFNKVFSSYHVLSRQNCCVQYRPGRKKLSCKKQRLAFC